MENYNCTICAYPYYTERGDPNFGIKPGISLEELPKVCVCSECGAGKTNLRRRAIKE